MDLTFSVGIDFSVRASKAVSSFRHEKDFSGRPGVAVVIREGVAGFAIHSPPEKKDSSVFGRKLDRIRVGVVHTAQPLQSFVVEVKFFYFPSGVDAFRLMGFDQVKRLHALHVAVEKDQQSPLLIE